MNMGHGSHMVTTAATIDMPRHDPQLPIGSPPFACSPTGNARHVIRANHARDALRGRSITHDRRPVSITDRAPAFVRVLVGLQAKWAPGAAPPRICAGVDDEWSVDDGCSGSEAG